MSSWIHLIVVDRTPRKPLLEGQKGIAGEEGIAEILNVSNSDEIIEKIDYSEVRMVAFRPEFIIVSR